MSGGSWDYVYRRIQDAADGLSFSKDPLRRAFGEHLKLVATAMHDIEWVDSCDYGPGDDVESIRKALPNANQAEAFEIIKELEKQIKLAEDVKCRLYELR